MPTFRPESGLFLFQAGLLVDAALNDLEPHKLVLFIQSFGIPVASMSKLLHKLDRIIQVLFNILIN